MTGRKPKATLRPATFEDAPAISELTERFGFGPVERGPWQRFRETNPAVADPFVNANCPPGWILETPEKKVVGYLQSIPLRYYLRGRPLRAVATSSWAVDPEYRGHSLSFIIKFFGQPVDICMNATARPPADKVFEGMKAQRVPVEHYDRALFWILDARGFLGSFLNKMNKPLLTRLGRGLAGLAPAGVATTELLRGKRLPRRSEYSRCIQWETGFGSDFDRFWVELLGLKHDVLLGARDRKTLTWHFQHYLDSGQAWLLTCREPAPERGREPGRLIAYSIFFRQDHPDSGLKRVRLADFQSLSTDDDVNRSILRGLLAQALRRFRSDKLEMLEVVGFNGATRRLLEEMAPYRRQLECFPYYYRPATPELAAELAPSERWEPSIYDGDASL